MRLQIGYPSPSPHASYVMYDDENTEGHTPPPEVVEDIMRRMERTLHRLATGKLPEDHARLSEFDTGDDTTS